MPPQATDLVGYSTAAKVRARWLAQRRPSQVPPTGDDWDVWLLLAGRGFGKSRCGAEWVWWRARSRPGTRWAVVAPTFADCRDTCVEGESGILASAAADDIAAWNRSIGELRLTNGSLVRLFSAEEPDRLRGPQFHGAWADELAAWEKGTETWDMLQFTLRLGDHPQVVVTTTPKPTRLVRQLVKQDNVTVTRGSTYENRANLAPTTLTSLLRRYEGTRLGRQELMGEILEDVEGALWTRALIPDPEDMPLGHQLQRVVVAIDPPGGGRAEAGIVAAGFHTDGRYWVLADRSGRMSPREWAATAIGLYRDLRADRIVAERNYGGDMVVDTIRSVDSEVPVRVVTATRGKQQRAEPVVALYEQKRVAHCRGLQALEDQMVEWVPGMGESPDRLDSCLAAGTPVMTARGEVPIEHVTVGDLAWTRQGWKPVLATRCTRRDADVMTVEFADGRRVTGTPDHLVWVEQMGWSRLDALVWDDRLSGWTNPPFLSSSTASPTSETPMGSNAPTGSTTRGREAADTTSCTGTSGEPPIPARSSPRGGTSTTSTRTRSTTTPPTSNYKRQPTTTMSTTPVIVPTPSASIWTTSGHVPRSGTAAPQATTTTSGWARSPGRDASTSSGLADTAVAATARPTPNAPVSALSDASRPPGTSAATSGNSSAPCAASLSGRTSTRTGPRPAHVRVASTCDAGQAHVYDLMVADVHEFVAGGVVVHNCVWALSELMDVEDAPVVAPGHGGQTSGWR